MGVGGAAPPAGFPPTHCRTRPGRHRRELCRSHPCVGGYLETRNPLAAFPAFPLLAAEPTASFWNTPSDERRRYWRKFDAKPENAAKKRARQKRYYLRHRER